MAHTSTGAAQWEGNLPTGKGTISLESSGVLTESPYSFQARAEGVEGVTTPEELLGAAHAACFSQAFALVLGEKGITPTSVETQADVTFDVTPEGPAITGIHLTNYSVIPGISEADFQEVAEIVKGACPVSKALAGVNITLTATLGEAE